MTEIGRKKLLRFRRLGVVVLMLVATGVGSCTDYDVSFSDQPCSPVLDFEITREDGYECPCQPEYDPEGTCRVSFYGGDGSVMIGSHHYQLNLTMHHDVEPGETLEVHDISGVDRGELDAVERDEVWVEFTGPDDGSRGDRCTEGLDDDEYPGFDSEAEGTITVERFEFIDETPYFDGAFDLDSMTVTTPSTRWELAGSAEIESGFHPDEIETDEDDESDSGDVDYDCDERCSYEHQICEEGSQIACYCAAACLCECTLDVGDYSGSDAEEYESCVQDNRGHAEMLHDPDGGNWGDSDELYTGDGHPCDQLK